MKQSSLIFHYCLKKLTGFFYNNADFDVTVPTVVTIPATIDSQTPSSTITIVIVLAVIVGLLIVIIIITGILIGARWRIRKTKTFTPTEHEYSSAYATVEEMREVLTQSNEAYSAALLARPRESFDNAGYEVIDGEEYSYIANSGESRGGRRTVRGESSGHGAYEVIDKEDITAGSDRDPQTTNPESPDHEGYEDMNGTDKYEDMSGRTNIELTSEQVAIEMVIASANSIATEIAETSSEEIETVKNDAYASALGILAKDVMYENAVVKLKKATSPEELPPCLQTQIDHSSSQRDRDSSSIEDHR